MNKGLFTFTLAAAVVVAANGVAGPVAPVVYSPDRNGKTGPTTATSLWTNHAATGPTASVSATCPSNANKVLFQPADTAGNFRIKANGSGTPTSGSAITDGSGWMKNWSDWLDINVAVSGTTISSYAVWTPVSDTVPYTCGAK